MKWSKKKGVLKERERRLNQNVATATKNQSPPKIQKTGKTWRRKGRLKRTALSTDCESLVEKRAGWGSGKRFWGKIVLGRVMSSGRGQDYNKKCKKTRRGALSGTCKGNRRSKSNIAVVRFCAGNDEVCEEKVSCLGRKGGRRSGKKGFAWPPEGTALI